VPQPTQPSPEDDTQPGKQLVHVACAALEYLPASQLVQPEADDLYVFWSHGLHSLPLRM
jgi:hypothetical protein